MVATFDQITDTAFVITMSLGLASLYQDCLTGQIWRPTIRVHYSPPQG